ncbi:hypothetical protein EON62_02670 [archaeon]|nr:MAG: hypothetical protein EON62_02670 [archaeon]
MASAESSTPLSRVKHELGLFVDISGEADVVQRELHAVCAAILGASWAAVPLEALQFTAVSGGITNALYKVTASDVSVTPHAALVRVFGLKTEVLIDREADNRTFTLMGEYGFGPRCFGIFGNGRVEQWLNARPLAPSEMGQREPRDMASGIASVVASLHMIDFPAAKQPVLWKVRPPPTRQRARARFCALHGDVCVASARAALQSLLKWFDMAATATFASGEASIDAAKARLYEQLNIPAIEHELRWMQSVLPSAENGHGADLLRAYDALPESEREARRAAAQLMYDVVFAHNDLLSGNILLEMKDMHDKSAMAPTPTEEGMTPGARLRVIDFEYGAYNYRGFDVANHFCEHAGFDFDLERWYPAPDLQRHWFQVYTTKLARGGAGVPAPLMEQEAFWDELYLVANRFALASHYWWGLWAIVQAQHSAIDFDFLGYCIMRFKGYEKHKHQFFGGQPEAVLVKRSATHQSRRRLSSIAHSYDTHDADYVAKPS